MKITTFHNLTSLYKVFNLFITFQINRVTVLYNAFI